MSDAPVDRRLLERRGDWRFTDCWHRTHTNYPITFVVIPGPQLHLQVTYAQDRVDAQMANALLDHYRRLLLEISRRREARLGEFAMVGDAERNLVARRWNETEYDYAEPRDIVGRFKRRTRLRPDAIAARCAGETISYGKLAQRAERLAAGLRRDGVETDELVALFDFRGLDFLVMMLGVFQAGAGYLPLEPANPDARIAQILDESRVRRVLCGAATLDRAEAIIGAMAQSDIRALDEGALERAIGDTPTLDARPRPTGLAFVIFTSGSTGKPKGAAVEHQGMFNNLITKERALDLTTNDVIAQTASQCFDISVWQFLTALAIGARVEVFPDDISRDPERLLSAIDAQGVTIFETVPSMIRALLDAPESATRLRRLRWLLPCGEAFSPELCRQFMARFPHVRLLNAYGPAECSDDVSYHPIVDAPQGDDLSVPIGKPVDNTQIYIVDRWLDLGPIGVAGEICVTGVQVGRGYLNRPDLTAASFVPDPFGADGARLYRTGDLGRWRRDGVIEFLGRVDHQVKIRGNRIEPGEIEARLASHPEVRAATVIVREIGKGAHRLIAYVVCAPERFMPEDLRRHIRAALPDYMAPEAFVRLDALPLSANGKVDRKALPEPEIEGGSVTWCVDPRTPTEERIAQIWMDLLDVPHVGANENFYDLGGHSLLAARIASRIRATFAIDLPLRALLEAPKLADLAARVDDARGRPSTASASPIVRASREGAIPLSNAQQRLWFMQQRDPTSSAYHFVVAVRISGPLDDALFDATLNLIVQRHESLRTVFCADDGAVRQRILPHLAIMTQRDVLGAAATREDDLIRLMTAFSVTPFDLERGPLIRCALYRLSESTQATPATAAILCFHHIIFDGWSFTVFLREFTAIYSALRAGRDPALPALAIHYTDYSVWHAERMAGAEAAADLAFWREHLRGAPLRLELPTDRPHTETSGHVAGSHAIELGDLQQALESFNRERAVTPFVTFFSAFAVLLRHLSGASDLVIGTDVANRPRIELESTIGFFVNLLALRVTLDDSMSFDAVVEHVRGVTLAAYDHQGFPFDKLVEAVKPERLPGYSPIFQTKIAFHNVPTPEFDLSDLSVDQLTLPSSHAELDLVLHVYQKPEGARLVFEYRAGLLDGATIARIAEIFRDVMRASLSQSTLNVSALCAIAAQRDATLREESRNALAAARHGHLQRVERKHLLS